MRTPVEDVLRRVNPGVSTNVVKRLAGFVSKHWKEISFKRLLAISDQASFYAHKEFALVHYDVGSLKELRKDNVVLQCGHAIGKDGRICPNAPSYLVIPRKVLGRKAQAI